MTGSNQLPLWMFPLPDAYPSDREGKILLRGGAKIRLHKCPDRFTVGLIHPIDHLTQWANRLDSELDCELLSIGQIALRVEADRLESVMARARRSTEVAFASHVYCVAESELKEAELKEAEPSRLDSKPFNTAQAQSILYLTNQIALQFQPQGTAQQIEAITRAAGLEVLKLIPGIPKAFVYRLSRAAIVNPLKLTNRLILHPDVLLAEPNVATFAHNLPEALDPLDFGKARAKGIHPAAGTRSIAVAVVDRSTGSSTATAGIDLNHPAFSGMGKIVAPLDLSFSEFSESGLSESGLSESEFFESDLEAIRSTAKFSWGTVCAQAAIGERSETIDEAIGIAPGCSLMPIAIDSLIDDSTIEKIFDWGMRQGAAVICGRIPNHLSLPPSLRQRSAIYRAAMQGRNGKGCVMVERADSAWKDLPDVVLVAIDPEPDDRAEAIAIGIEAGIAAQVLSANPDLTALEVRQILQTVHAEKGHAQQDNDVFTALELAVSLAKRQVSQFADGNRIGGADRQVLAFADRSPQPIPDGGDRGMIRTLTIQQAGVIRNFEVELTIDHPFLGDLKIWLIPPVGDAILLQDRTLGRLNRIHTCYGLGNTPHLKSLLGRSALGLWQLQICDCAPGHAGVLQEWQLRFSVD